MPYAYLLPAFLIIGPFVLAPIGYSAYLSLLSWDFIRPAPLFVGLDNYRRLLGASDFWRALANTLVYAAETVPLGAAVGLGVAVLLNRPLRGRAFYRTAFFAPVVTSTVAVSTVWMWMYHPDVGLINAALERVGVRPVAWLSDPRTALTALALMAVWKGLGYHMVLFLAGLQGIPRAFEDAAEVDGASRWQVFRRITLPLLVPTLLFVLVISTIDAVQVFTQVHVMTQGGPAGSTEVLVYNLWHHGFQMFEMGYASAIAWVIFAILLALTALQLHLVGRHAEWQWDG